MDLKGISILINFQRNVICIATIQVKTLHIIIVLRKPKNFYQ